METTENQKHTAGVTSADVGITALLGSLRFGPTGEQTTDRDNMAKAALVIERLSSEMRVISDYDKPRKDGICDYGCDCPHLAQGALAYVLGLLPNAPLSEPPSSPENNIPREKREA